jgi:hypothetical protein
MRVEHLVIVTFPKRSDFETEGVGKSLYDRYTNREKFRPKTACIIRFPANQFRNEESLEKFATKLPTYDLVAGAKPNSDVQVSENVGVFLVCHGYSRRPIILGAQYSSQRCDKWQPVEYADTIAAILYGLGLRKIRKLCLMVCGTESSGSSGDPRLAEVLSVALAKKMGSPPAVAGYDGYISTLWSEELDPDFPEAKAKGLPMGAKLVKVNQGGSEKRSLASANLAKVRSIKFVCINGKTTILAESGWSDKNRGEDWTPSLDSND